MLKDFIDAGYRAFYRLAFGAAQAWWFVRRPSHTGALVAVWCGGRILLLRQSYQTLWTLPGGGVAPGEEPQNAAARELGEEVKLDVLSRDLRPVGSYEHIYRWRHDLVHIFELDYAAPPNLLPDRREIIEARWMTPEEIQDVAVIPHLRSYLEHPRCGTLTSR